MLSIEVPQVNAINSIHTETDATRTAHSMHLAALDFTRPDDPNLCERRREMNDKKIMTETRTEMISICMT